ncbi:DNA ligase 4 [Paramyrothecium foliicola]|nr:DNA ligase 4 [Paramyrothecium foliicola]
MTTSGSQGGPRKLRCACSGGFTHQIVQVNMRAGAGGGATPGVSFMTMWVSGTIPSQRVGYWANQPKSSNPVWDGGTGKEHKPAVTAWFARHRDRINAHDTNIAAILSTLLPEKRTDRVYCIRAATLEKIIGRSLMLGASRISELALYRKPGHGADLADCVERILSVTPNPASSGTPLTVEEIDAVLHRIASKTKWSSPSVRKPPVAISTRNRSDLEDVYRQLCAREAKWFTRLVLKDYRPVILDPHLLLGLCDPLLPSVLKIQEDFSIAIGVVASIRNTLLPNASRKTSGKGHLLYKIKPKLGIKVGRQHWLKGRSIKHCLDMGHGRMSVEQKLDGEYCQIHVDVSKGRRNVQIFSKSGKDSTEDRREVLSTVLDALKLGQPDCQIRKNCILEGELLAYDHKNGKILPFHKIRKYVSRRGLLLNTEQDSPPKAHEKLMIVYYDILLWDDESLLGVRHSERFKLLESLITSRKGHAELVERATVDFGRSGAASHLRRIFARTICLRGEGLVLKPDGPYFDFNEKSRPFASCCIKLKKEYIGRFGDVGDFAVVGAGFDPAKSKTYRIPGLQWTHFFIACLNNKDEVRRWKSTPDFTVVNIVEVNESLLETLIRFGNPMPVSAVDNAVTRLHIAPGIPNGIPLTVAFTNPLVFDMRCFSFDKAGNTGFWSLRFPIVTKIHFDRDYTDAITFAELQALAIEATTAPELEDSQENLRWIAELEHADPGGIAVDAASQLTASTIPTPSPRSFTKVRSETSSGCVGTASSLLNDAIRCENEPPNVVAGQHILPVFQQLVTPPTSSPPQVPLSESNAKIHLNKRPALPTATPVLFPKRQKVSSHSQPSPTSTTKLRKQQQTRRALEDIDGNSSQHSVIRHISFTADMDHLSQEVPKSAACSPVVSFTSPASNCHASSLTDTGEGFREDVTLDIASASSETANIDRPSRPCSPATELPDELLRFELQVSHFYSTGSCMVSDAACPLKDFVLLIPPPVLEHCHLLSNLLDGHGFHAIPSGQDDRMQTENRDNARVDKADPPIRRVMLVDSIDRKVETMALLSSMEHSRVTSYEYEREWIEIFDWRLLRDITAQESRSNGSQQFEGFSNPWKRWFCGLV